MIKKLWIRNFGLYENVTIPLDDFTVFIGANGVGKSFIFTALRALGRIARHPLRYNKPSRVAGYSTRTGGVDLNDLVHKGETNRVVTLGAEFATPKAQGTWEVQLSCWKNPGGMLVGEQLHVHFEGRDWSLRADENGQVEHNFKVPNSWLTTPRFMSAPAQLYKSRDLVETELAKHLQEVFWDRLGLFRLDPTALKTPAAIGERFSATGYHFASYLDQIRNEAGGKEEFESLLERFRSLCPHVKDVLLPSDSRFNEEEGPRKRINLVMSASDATIPADLESDGTILMLAYVSLLHGSRAHDTLCIEEPENGIHPSAIAGLVKALQALTQPYGAHAGAQILVSTHSRPFMDAVADAQHERLRLVRRGSDGRSTVETVPFSRLPALPGWAGLT